MGLENNTEAVAIQKKPGELLLNCPMSFNALQLIRTVICAGHTEWQQHSGGKSCLDSFCAIFPLFHETKLKNPGRQKVNL